MSSKLAEASARTFLFKLLFVKKEKKSWAYQEKFQSDAPGLLLHSRYPLMFITLVKVNFNKVGATWAKIKSKYIVFDQDFT